MNVAVCCCGNKIDLKVSAYRCPDCLKLLPTVATSDAGKTKSVNETWRKLKMALGELEEVSKC
ncbi:MULTISPECIES: hypothetical protein [Laceyella]|uniref:Inhibitor of sigma-G Gin protein n=2 Tax=Laceyella TaxID=292635 RepID=A0ABY5U5T4_LACSH|nr:MULTISPECIES: hypothetical protein [Laceyella]PRZ16322.1 hypothetical protein CLV36_10230 [Laceyella sediminis]UWE03408.1 hypothetical protein NYR52_15085 [Laceyella sacchari]